MTYRIVRVPMTDRPGKFVMEGGRYIGELVPVEPCKHGNYTGHIIGDSITSEIGSVVVYYDWCPGAGVGETP